jgi:RNA polymerase sigma factor (sigma-70 family)
MVLCGRRSAVTWRQQPEGFDSPINPEFEQEARLVEQARAGSERAFSALLARYQQPVFRLIYYLVGNEEEARDLTRIALKHALRRMPRVPPGYSIRPWLLRVASLVALDAVREQNLTPEDIVAAIPALQAPQRQTEVIVDADPTLSDTMLLGIQELTANPEATIAEAWDRLPIDVERALIRTLLANMPESDAELLALGVVGQVPTRDLAAIAGTSQRSIRRRIARALILFQSHYQAIHQTALPPPSPAKELPAASPNNVAAIDMARRGFSEATNRLKRSLQGVHTSFGSIETQERLQSLRQEDIPPVGLAGRDPGMTVASSVNEIVVDEIEETIILSASENIIAASTVIMDASPIEENPVDPSTVEVPIIHEIPEAPIVVDAAAVSSNNQSTIVTSLVEVPPIEEAFSAEASPVDETSLVEALPIEDVFAVEAPPAEETSVVGALPIVEAFAVEVSPVEEASIVDVLPSEGNSPIEEVPRVNAASMDVLSVIEAPSLEESIPIAEDLANEDVISETHTSENVIDDHDTIDEMALSADAPVSMDITGEDSLSEPEQPQDLEIEITDEILPASELLLHGDNKQEEQANTMPAPATEEDIESDANPFGEEVVVVDESLAAEPSNDVATLGIDTSETNDGNIAEDHVIEPIQSAILEDTQDLSDKIVEETVELTPLPEEESATSNIETSPTAGAEESIEPINASTEVDDIVKPAALLTSSSDAIPVIENVKSVEDVEIAIVDNNSEPLIMEPVTNEIAVSDFVIPVSPELASDSIIEEAPGSEIAEQEPKDYEIHIPASPLITDAPTTIMPQHDVTVVIHPQQHASDYLARHQGAIQPNIADLGDIVGAQEPHETAMPAQALMPPINGLVTVVPAEPIVLGEVHGHSSEIISDLADLHGLAPGSAANPAASHSQKQQTRRPTRPMPRLDKSLIDPPAEL